MIRDWVAKEVQVVSWDVEQLRVEEKLFKLKSFDGYSR
jgi:hypothetical protein